LKMAFRQRQFGLTLGVELSPEETADESQIMVAGQFERLNP
jgi:hypothetical protein